jgi:arylsulfatase A-like enzyme
MPKSIPALFLLTILTGFLEAKPNLVIILADDLGYGDIGAFEQKTLKTPWLDKMASEGMRLTQFYAGCTVCAPSRSVLMTGKHMGHTIVRGNSSEPIILQPGTTTLASLLKTAGYATGCVGKWGIGTPDNLTNPNDVGFDHFYGYINMWHAHNCFPEYLIRDGKVEKLDNVVADKWKPFQDPRSPMGGRGVAIKRAQYAPDLFVTDSLAFIRKSQQEEKPFFLYYALNLPHANNEGGQNGMEAPSNAPFDTENWPEPEKGFAAVIKKVDGYAGQVMELLRELGIEKKTLVLFTSDNGPHREGGHSPDFFDSNGQYRGIKRDLYEGGIRVPTIAWWPGTIEAGSQSPHQWYFGDIMATAAELSSQLIPCGLNSDSFLGTLKGSPPANEWERKSPLYWEFYEGNNGQAVRFGKWKAIRRPMFTGKIELFDISVDEEEAHDVSKENPGLVEQAVSLMQTNHVPDPNWKPKAPRKK